MTRADVYNQRMGYEYRLRVDRPLKDLDAACEAVFRETGWRRIATSLTGVANGIGVQAEGTPPDAPWRHDADLYLEDSQTVFAVAHGDNGADFVRALITQLEADAYAVHVDADV